MSPLHALGANLLSGVSCIIGGVVAVYANMSPSATGGALAFGGGTYVWIAATECFPKLLHVASGKDVLLRFGTILAGIVVIALVLINHQHCAAPGSAHEGHGH